MRTLTLTEIWGRLSGQGDKKKGKWDEDGDGGCLISVLIN